MADYFDDHFGPPAPSGWTFGTVFSGIADSIGGALTGGDDPKTDQPGAINLPGAGLLQGATDAVLGQYPGYGTLWTYSTSSGVALTQEGCIAAAVAALGVWWVLK